MTIWDVAIESPHLTFFAFWILVWGCVQPFKYVFLAYNRTIRGRNIAAHGWPTAPMDADGDVVYPEKDGDK